MSVNQTGYQVAYLNYVVQHQEWNNKTEISKELGKAVIEVNGNSINGKNLRQISQLFSQSTTVTGVNERDLYDSAQSLIRATSQIRDFETAIKQYNDIYNKLLQIGQSLSAKQISSKQLFEAIDRVQLIKSRLEALSQKVAAKNNSLGVTATGGFTKGAKKTSVYFNDKNKPIIGVNPEGHSYASITDLINQLNYNLYMSMGLVAEEVSVAVLPLVAEAQLGRVMKDKLTGFRGSKSVNVPGGISAYIESFDLSKLTDREKKMFKGMFNIRGTTGLVDYNFNADSGRVSISQKEYSTLSSIKGYSGEVKQGSDSLGLKRVLINASEGDLKTYWGLLRAMSSKEFRGKDDAGSSLRKALLKHFAFEMIFGEKGDLATAMQINGYVIGSKYIFEYLSKGNYENISSEIQDDGIRTDSSFKYSDTEASAALRHIPTHLIPYVLYATYRVKWNISESDLKSLMSK